MRPDSSADLDVAPLSLRALVRATPLVVWALCLVFGVLGAAQAVLVPVLHGPDEGAHVDRIAGIDGQFGVAPLDQLTYSPDLLAAFAEVGIVPVDHRVVPRQPWAPLNTADAQPRGARPTWPDLAPPGTATNPNAAVSHPPAYYALVDGVDRLASALGVADLDEAPWDNVVARWRMLSAVLLLPLPWITFWVTRRATRSASTAVTAAALTLAVPQLSHSAGTVNNDALLLLATWVCLLGCAWLATGDLGWRPAVLAGAGAGLGVLSKVFALGGPVWIVLAVWVGTQAGSATDRLRRGTAPVLVAAGATVVAGGWWPLWQLATSGTLSPRRFNYPQPDDVSVSVAAWLREAVERLTSTGFGRFGIEQFGIPGWLVTAASLATVVLLVAGAGWIARERGGGLAVSLLIPLATTLAMVGFAAWGGYVRSGLPTGLHGRYLFVAAPGVAAVAAAGLVRLAGKLPGRGPGAPATTALGAALGAAVLLQSQGLWVALRSYWSGGVVDQVRTAMILSGWSDPFLGLLGVAGLASLAALAVGLRRQEWAT